MIVVRKYGWFSLIILIIIICIVVFFYFDRQNEISNIILAWGFWGAIIAILLMGVMCMTPIPSEGLLILYLKIYGIYLGILYSWVGSIIGSLAIFIIARNYGQELMQKKIRPEQIKVVDSWVNEKGSLGLLIARLLPIPAFVVNYIAGVMPSMKLWSYLWTAAISMAPYYISTGMVFIGVTRKSWLWLIWGGIVLILFSSIKYINNKRKFLQFNKRVD